jgi:ATP-dependent protease ClpP protease subunit
MPTGQFKIGIKNLVTADAGGDVCELYFLDAIRNPTYYDWESGEQEEGSLLENVISQIRYYNPSKIMIYIDSLGGSAPVGFAVYNFLKNHPARVECKILGMCGSIATIIACSAKKVTMPKNGFYIIHEAENVAVGRACDLREGADITDKYTDQLCDVWSQKTSIPIADIKALIAPGDHWMTGTEAKAAGFVDEIYNSADVSVTAMIKVAVTANVKVPDNILALQEIPESNDSILSKIENTMKNFGEMVTAAVEKFKGTKVTAKVGDEMQVDLSAAMQPVLADLAANMQTEVTAEISKVKDEVTASITASFEEKYGATITALQAENKDLKKDMDTITADMTNIAGAEARPGNKTTTAAGNSKKERATLAGA